MTNLEKIAEMLNSDPELAKKPSCSRLPDCFGYGEKKRSGKTGITPRYFSISRSEH